MSDTIQRNRTWAEKLIRTVDPSFRQRWDIYDGILKRLTGRGTRWLDGGCGKNVAIEEFPCDFTIGLDRYRHPEALTDGPCFFVIGSMEKLPFNDNSLTLVTLNTVVEHFKNPKAACREILRVLRPDGHLLIHTTNRLSPLIFLGTLLPEALRFQLMKHAFGAKERDVFKTYHRLNTLPALRSLEGFDIEECHAVQDLNWSNRLLFLGLLAFHLVTKLPGLWRLRTNMVVLLRKKG